MPDPAGPDYFAKVTLTGTQVRLEPLAQHHSGAFAAAGTDPSVWRWMPSEHHAPGMMQAFIDAALPLQAARLAVPFATVDVASGKTVGSTRFLNVEPQQRRLEIGFTWISAAFQRSHVNTETKLLQLWYAFEILGCRRVEFKADAENMKSRTAILRLGAKEEGFFRKHMLYADGRNRDSVYFSIIDDEWPDVRAGLVSRLAYEFAPSWSEAE
ncbi:MAG: GNAT family N-acetyltransferase [Methylovirgula sp.]